MAEKELRLAIVGTGGIAKVHRNNLAVIGDNKIVAVCDVSEENLKEAADASGATPYTDFGKLMDSEKDLDALVLCTPPIVRREVIEAACDRGLPVYCEKPPARTDEDASEIARIVEKSGNIVSVGFMYRYLPAVDHLRSLIGSKPINLVEGTYLCGVALARNIPDWFFIRERSGGHVVDQAIHMIDIIRYIAGPMAEVHTLGNNVICPKADDFTVEDSSSTNIRFASGASGCHVHSWANSGWMAEATFTGAEYRLTLKLNDTVHGQISGETVEKTFAPPPSQDIRYWIMEAFLKAVRTGDASDIRSPYADAAGSLAAVNAMNRSIDEGRPISL